MPAVRILRTELAPVVGRSLARHPGAGETASERALLGQIDSVARHVVMSGASTALRLRVAPDAAGLFNRVMSDLLAGSHWRARYERRGIHRILIDAGVVGNGESYWGGGVPVSE